MSSKQITKTVYTIDSHPNKQKVFEWVRNNWHDLNQYDVDDLIESLEKMAQAMGASLDYSISQVEEYGEHIDTLVTMCSLMRRY